MQKNYFREHPETMKKIELAIRAKVNLAKAEQETTPEVKALPGAPVSESLGAEKVNSKKSVSGASVSK